MRYTAKRRQEIIDDFMARNGGRFDPAAFVAEAESDQHPAHGWFTWDDAAAAHQHRIAQARSFVHGLRINFTVEVITPTEPLRAVVTTAPAYISPLESRRTGGYIAVDPSNPAAMAGLAREGAIALRAWLRRYGGAVLWAQGEIGAVEAVAKMLELVEVPEAEDVA